MDRLPLRTISGESPEAQISGGEARFFWQRLEDNAFHLENEDRVPNADQVLHPRGVPVRETNATMTSGAADCLGIICAVNANARLV